MSAQAAVNRLSEMLGSEHPFVLAAQMNLAVCKAESGDLAGALELVDNLHKMMRTVLGPRHPDTLRAAANLALIRNLREPDSGPEELETVVAELVERLGGDHPDVRVLGHRKLLDRVLDPHPF